ncbi:MAG: penicillin-binding protein 2, partial [Proteobacteria bacterium]|nr:penicillin-binding protein 2 [Pseudomonadota bacterium]
NGERGNILDRNMNPLATSTEAFSITANPSEIKDPAAIARKLSAILGMNAGKLEKQLSSDRKFTLIARTVPPAQKDQIEQLNHPQIFFEKDSKRLYPNRDLAAQVLGFTGLRNQGLEGLEYKYNEILDGQSIRIKIKKDKKGGVLSLNQLTQLKGKSIVLTLDKKIQFFSEKTLEHTVRTYHAKSGMALVMQPETGEFLSIAHFPKFNPNNFSAYDQAIFRNRAVTDPFEPGSAMKVFTAAAALENGFDPKAIFDCNNGTYKVGTFTIHDTHPHDWLSINQIIKFSSNIGAVKIAETIGNKTLHQYLTSFGFGEKTWIDSPGETAGSLLPYHKWSKIDASAISFGQGISVSAVQLISAISTIANNGLMMKPMLIKKIISSSGEDELVYRPEPVRQVISPDTARKIKRMMNLVTHEDGTGTKAAMDGYPVCGKTGTAQKVRQDKKGYSNTRYTAVFAGFAPLKDPKLAILVIIDEPEKKYHGGEVAAPAFKTIMEESFSYLNIPPETDKNMIALMSGGVKQ